MKILILGDVGASKTNVESFCNGDRELFSFDIQKICQSADMVFLNLEKPLTDIITPLGKCPPDFAAPTKTINGINLLCPTAVTLANNHIMDQKEQGLYSTIRTLNENGIQYVGVGKNKYEANKPLIISKDGLHIGIYACCEKEYSFAGDNSPGSNGFDPLESVDDISSLRAYCDYLIVLYHGGTQGYPYPTPYLQKVCRKMCEKGADLIVCQHSHIVGCEEEYLQSKIIYGQGNFLLDEINYESWHTGIMLEVSLTKKEKCSFKYIPIMTKNHKVHLHQEYKKVLNDYKKRSEEIKSNNEVNRRYQDYCKQQLPTYLLKLAGTPIILQKVLRRLGLVDFFCKLKFHKIDYQIILDYLYCDSHREAIETGIDYFLTNLTEIK